MQFILQVRHRSRTFGVHYIDISSDYEIDEDSIQVYENDIVDTICREYIMISTTDNPRIKKWRKGTTITGEYINYSKALREAYSEYQEEFKDLF